jgi:sugar/nucleoside kinase (ribokinase family)
MGIPVIGSVALDSIKTPFGNKDEILGGSAAYFSVAASYFVDVSILAAVGEDLPDAHIDFLRGKGIDISGLQRRPGKTFRWKGEYGKELNTLTTLAPQLNVFADFAPELSRDHRRQQFLFLGNIDPDRQHLVLEQMDRTSFVACGTMDYWIESKRSALLKTLSKIDLLIINDAEIQQLANESNIIQAAGRILAMGPKAIVVRRGEYGVLMFSANKVFCIPAFPIEDVLDPTGAGDSFAGGLMGYIASVGKYDDTSLRKAVVFGSVMTSFCVAEFGMRQLGDLTYTEIESRYHDFHKLTCFEDTLE